MIETRITKTLGIKHPILLAGMNYVTTPKLVAAVSNAGGLGILAGAAYTRDQFRECIREIRSLTDKPFGVNITLFLPGARDLVEVVLDEKPPVVNYALGRAVDMINAVHAYGGKIIASVAIAKHAMRAEKDGADILTVTGCEAAAHGASVGSMVLIPTIARRVSIPIVGAGGFCDGHGLVAALALGAEGVSMGTRFALSTESPLHDYYKQLSIESTEEDTFITDRWDGLPARLLNTEAAQQLARRRLPGIESATSMLRIKRELGLSWYELVAGTLRMKQVEQLSLGKMVVIPVGFSMLKRAVFDGARDGVMLTGQNTGMMSTLHSCQEIVDQTIGEAETILKNLQSVTRGG